MRSVTCPRCGKEKPPLRSLCRECTRSYNLAWRAKHPSYWVEWQAKTRDARRASQREYSRANRARINARRRMAYASNPERFRAIASEWRAANPDKAVEVNRRSQEKNREQTNRRHREDTERRGRYRLHCVARRARKRSVVSDLTKDQWAEIVKSFGGRCAYCGCLRALTMDHVIPLVLGGGHTASNIVPACRSCNSSKQDRLPGDFIKGVARCRL
jgi:5-methylcytosine-specific restriction endonuclease McrA